MKLDSLARFCYRNRWLVVALWIASLAGVVVGARFFGGEISNNVSLPGTESQEVIDLLEKKFPELSGDQASIAFKADAGVTEPAIRRQMDEVFADFRNYDHVLSVADPYDPRVPRISRSGKIGYATVQFDVSGPELPKAQIEQMGRRIEEARTPGLQVELGGESIRFGEIEGPGEREGVGLAAAIVILLIAFGSVVAMGLPIITAIFGLGIGLSLITILANAMDLNVFAPQVASMIGLGVGIDYALFIVTRFREALRGGDSVQDSVAIATSTSGRAVLFAGITVIISLLAMFLTRIPFIYGFAVAPAITVLVIMIASITLLPAILSVAGRRIDRLRIPGLGRHTEKQRTLAYRWSRTVQHHPWIAAGAGTMALLVLAAPVVSLRMGWAGAGSNPESRTTRRAYDLLAEGFGPGFNEPLIAVAVFPNGNAETLGRIARSIQETTGVAVVAPPQLSKSRDAAVIPIIAATAPDDERTEDLIVALREEVLPSATGESGARIFLGGITPAFFDMSEILTERLPILMVGVILLSFILLMAVFRSLLVPVKAALMNLLSIGAAYGVVVAVFQWGWLGGFFDIGRPGPIESFAPMMLFAILFGLSMDYEVFLLSRVQEEYLRTGNNNEAVADGLASTARVITAAAAIMVTLFLSFVLGDERVIKLTGLGLAVAVLVDATLIRMLLVPATMELMGKANWWLPRWLAAILPGIRVEGPRPVMAASFAPAAPMPASGQVGSNGQPPAEVLSGTRWRPGGWHTSGDPGDAP